MNIVAVNEHEIANAKIQLAWEDIEGHDQVKRAIEVALVGGHPIAILANRHSNAGALVKMVAAKTEAWGILFRAVVYPVCPCGNYGSITDECRCSVETVESYLKGIAAKRGDFHIWMESIEYPPKGKRYPVESLDAIMHRAKCARESVTPSDDAFGKSDFVSMYLREIHPTALDMKIAVAVAVTIARMDGKKEVESVHIAEALQYGFLACGAVRNWAAVETVEVGV